MDTGHGNTLTYQQLATRIHYSKEYRCVGNACGKNNLAMVVPCHRIISSAGLGNMPMGMQLKNIYWS